ncbi:MAG: response regulator [Verrucomicrobiota bacterium]
MKQHILVVDDEKPITDLLNSFFKKHGYEVRTAANARDALRFSLEFTFDLIILDIVLPDTESLELLDTFRAEYPEIPVILITGIGFDEELLQEALHKGAAGYISKTLPLEQLLMEVHRVLKKSRRPSQAD